MPRDISAGLQAHLAQEELTLAFCVRVVRADGTVLRFTSLDKPLTINGETYDPSAAISASSIRTTEGTGVDNFDVTGLINSDNIRDVDLRGGIYDDAEVEGFIVNYEDLTEGLMIVISGTIANINFVDGMYKVEVRSKFQRLGQQIVALTSPACRVKEFLDQQCNGDGTLDPVNFRFARVVKSVQSAHQITFASDTHATGSYDYGVVEMRTDPNMRIRREIKSHALVGSDAVITLQEPFPFTVSVGDMAGLVRGCNRTAAQCIAYGNMHNFRGEPHIPGTDQILRQPRR